MPGHDGDKISRLRRSKTMNSRDGDDDIFSPKNYGRVQNWIRRHDFHEGESVTNNYDERMIASLTRCNSKKSQDEYNGIKVEQRTEVVKCLEAGSSHKEFDELIKPAKRVSKLKLPKNRKKVPTHVKPATQLKQYIVKSQSASPMDFPLTKQGNESELPKSVTKPSEFSMKSTETTHRAPLALVQMALPPSRPSSRHKRPTELIQSKQSLLERKHRKKRADSEQTPPSMFADYLWILTNIMIVFFLITSFDMMINPDLYENRDSFSWLWS